MMKLTDLPTEILIKIFQKNSDHQNRYQLISLSKTTKPIVQPIAYQHITLKSHQSIRLLSATLRSNPNLAELIHSINLISHSDCTSPINPNPHYHHHHHHHHHHHYHHITYSPKQNHDESMTFFAFSALLRYTHRITHLELDLQGSNAFELTQLFQAISQSKSSTCIKSLTYLTRSYSSLSAEPDLTQLISNLTSLTSLFIIGYTKYSNLHRHHHHHHHHTPTILTNISTTTSSPRSNHRHPPHQSNPAPNHLSKLVLTPPRPPIKSLTINSSRLISDSTSNIHKLIKLFSSTLTSLTICGVNEIMQVATTEWAETIQDKLESLRLIGTFFHGDQHESTVELLALDWSSIISKFTNLKKLELVNNINWLDSIPIRIPMTSPITAFINASSTNQTADYHHPVDLPDPQPTASSSSSHTMPTPTNTMSSSQDQIISLSISPPQTDPNHIPSSLSIIDNLSKPTHSLDYARLAMLPKSLKELRIETEVKSLKGKNKDNEFQSHYTHNHATRQSFSNNSPNFHGRNPYTNDQDDDDLINHFIQYQVDPDLNWQPIHLWSNLENLDLIVLNHIQYFRPSDDLISNS